MSLFIISCGGTGGHLSPGIALAEALRAEGYEAKLIISEKEVDSRLVTKYPELQFVRAPGSGFTWSPHGFIRFFLGQLRGLFFALKLIRESQPAAVVGFGGFITGSVVVAAFLLRCPVVLHEANRKPGKAIRFLSGLAHRVYLPEGVHLGSIPPQTVRHYGYPVRKEIRRIPRDKARQKQGLDIKGKLLLVLGGSQGAVALNNWVTENFSKLGEAGVNVLCITGLNKGTQGMIEHIRKDGHSTKAYFRSFCDDMASLLSAGDLVISRAGAGSLAEFIRCRLPSILVPYPHSADDHQIANAYFLEQQGGCIVVLQENMDRLLDETLELIFNDWLLNTFRSNLERLDRNNSTQAFVRDLEEIAESRKHAGKREVLA